MNYRTKQRLQVLAILLAFPTSTIAFTGPGTTIRNRINLVNHQNPEPQPFLPFQLVQAQAKRKSNFPIFAVKKNSKQDIIEPSLQHTPTEKSVNNNRNIQPHHNLNHGVHPILYQAWNTIRTTIAEQNKRTMIFVAASLIMASAVLTPLEALAAPSGGRMGGSFGGSSRGMGGGSSRSFSSPSRGMGGGGYGGGYSRGYNSGYYRQSPIIVAPAMGGYGYGYGGQAISRGPNIVNFIFFGILASTLVNGISGGNVDERSALGSGVTVAKISVAINVSDRNDPSSILSFLDRLSQTARTDSRVGISNLISQVALELLRQKRSVFGAYAETEHFSNGEKAEREFNSKAIEERSKFETESTNNYGGVDYSMKEAGGSVLDGGGGQATSAVVTLIVTMDGDETTFPKINGIRDLEQALTRLATDVKVDNCLRSAEVLWTPDNGNDILSEREVIVDYPKLRNI